MLHQTKKSIFLEDFCQESKTVLLGYWTLSYLTCHFHKSPQIFICGLKRKNNEKDISQLKAWPCYIFTCCIFYPPRRQSQKQSVYKLKEKLSTQCLIPLLYTFWSKVHILSVTYQGDRLLHQYFSCCLVCRGIRHYRWQRPESSQKCLMQFFFYYFFKEKNNKQLFTFQCVKVKIYRICL